MKQTPLEQVSVITGRFIPAGSPTSTSEGQRAFLSSELPVTWDKSLPARTADVQR